MAQCSKKDWYCFICGRFTLDRNKRLRCEKVVNLYRAYYESEWADDMPYAPNSSCSACNLGLSDWSAGRRDKIRFKSPMIWMDPGDIHLEEECYYCVNSGVGINASKRRSMHYRPTIFAVLPVEHTHDSPPIAYRARGDNTDEEHEQAGIEQFNVPMDIDADDEPIAGPSFRDSRMTTSSLMTTSYQPSHNVDGVVELVSLSRLNNMCRRLELSQRKSMMLATMLNENNLLADGVYIKSQKHRQEAYIPFFETQVIPAAGVEAEASLSFCVDIAGLMAQMNIVYVVNDWRLFIDGSKSSLKAVLLHNDNRYMPIPVAYSRTMKETHRSIKIIFKKIKYMDHKWDVSGDLKVVALIEGLQLGRTRNACFICTWICTAKIDHYHAIWEKRGAYKKGVMNVVRRRLVPPDKVLLPPLHIKLGLITSYIKQLVKNKNEEAIKFLALLFPKLSMAKIQGGERKDVKYSF